MELNFSKYEDGLIPAIVQDAETKNVLMLGFMNEEAVEKTKIIKKITFFSRSKQRLWTKGEESDNFLKLVSIASDCDDDTLLVKATPVGPVCHKGTDTCWGEMNEPNFGFFSKLEEVISERKNNGGNTDSYVASLFNKGTNKIAQKVGEEAVELVIEAKDDNSELFLNEAADLFFHYLILLKQKGFSLKNVEEILKNRHNQ